MGVFEAFEKDVMNAILSESSNELAPIIFQQYRSSSVISREFTGVGFYTNFQLHDESLRLKSDDYLRLGNIYAEVNGLKYGAGFLLLVKKGAIFHLEGHSYEEEWPVNITDYKLSKINPDGSLSQWDEVGGCFVSHT